ncbi:MAG: hypothetical protein J7J31_07295 [Helicobacteraceae bacterium]|nr:hypothetical protein [Helicobacteraceae bacterium]
MEVKQYLFQSPYSSQVQIGRPDPSVEQNQKVREQTQSLVSNTNQTAKEAQQFNSTQTKEVTPSVASKDSLDLYA